MEGRSRVAPTPPRRRMRANRKPPRVYTEKIINDLADFLELLELRPSFEENDAETLNPEWGDRVPAPVLEASLAYEAIEESKHKCWTRKGNFLISEDPCGPRRVYKNNWWWRM